MKKNIPPELDIIAKTVLSYEAQITELQSEIQHLKTDAEVWRQAWMKGGDECHAQLAARTILCGALTQG